MKRCLTPIAAALAVLFFALSPLSASAATAPAPDLPTTSSSGLSITPRKDLHITPGESITDKLTISNLDNHASLILTLKPIDFTFTDESGTPKLFLADNAPQTAWSIKPFLKLPSALTIGPGESKTVNYTLTVPKNQGAGSFYSAIEYIATGANGGNVSLNASGVTLVFVTIPGAVNEKMTLQKFGAYQLDDTGTTGKFLYIATKKSPEQVAFALKNQGNVAEAPSGSISIKNMFGHTVVNIENANPTSSLALIGQTRLFTSCLRKTTAQVNFQGTNTKTTKCDASKLPPGRYTASMDILYGQNGNTSQEITAVATFWYLPWWFLIVVLVAILLIAGGIWWAYRKVTNRARRKASGRRFRR